MEEAEDARQRAVIRVLKQEVTAKLMEGQTIDARQRAVIRVLKQEATV